MPQDHKSAQKSIAKSAGIFGAVTMLSRVLGFVRDFLSAWLFGTSIIWDAFIIAYTIPNMFRTLLGEGALTGAFVPIFTKYLHDKGEKSAWEFVNKSITLLSLLLILIIVVCCCILGFFLNFEISYRLREILILSIILLPYLFFVSNVGLFMGILNSFYHFFLPAFSPVIQNIVFICVTIALVKIDFWTLETKVIVLSLGISLGGALQFVSQYMLVRKKGLRYKFIFDLKDEGVRKVWTLMIPSIIGLSIYQINLAIDRGFAYFIGQGVASSLYFSNRLIQLPIGLFGVALATTSFPVMSHHIAQNKIEDFKKVLSHVTQLMVFITLPASVGLMVLSYPIIRMIYEHGKFDVSSTATTSVALFYYSFGLVAYCCSRVIIRAFYALQDTKTPVRIGFITLVLNIIFILIFMYPLKQGGLALATSLSSFVGYFMMVLKLNKRVGHIFMPEFYRSLKISAFATAIMAVVSYGSYILLSKIDFPLHVGKVVSGIAPVVIGGVVYLFIAYLFKSDEIKEVAVIIKSKFIKKTRPISNT